jgi:hypothetical protein
MDLYHNVKCVRALDAVNVAGSGNTVDGIVVDTAGYESVTFIISVGIAADNLSGALYHTIKLMHDTASAFNADPADVAAADCMDLKNTIVIDDETTEDIQPYKLAYKGARRYVRLSVVQTGNCASGTPMSAVAVLGSPRKAPPAYP